VDTLTEHRTGGGCCCGDEGAKRAFQNICSGDSALLAHPPPTLSEQSKTTSTTTGGTFDLDHLHPSEPAPGSSLLHPLHPPRCIGQRAHASPPLRTHARTCMSITLVVRTAMGDGGVGGGGKNVLRCRLRCRPWDTARARFPHRTAACNGYPRLWGHGGAAVRRRQSTRTRKRNSGAPTLALHHAPTHHHRHDP
jgi:hypothetical protein